MSLWLSAKFNIETEHCISDIKLPDIREHP